ncbi:alpha/beta hydrolase [Streptomyces sp. NPDC021020]|uniref:alpha/beta hydrolase n=1 Tax=Streptomyces sp. NPDC021020 TaxID=3365109 RepID=UPI00378D2FF9
MQTGFVTSLAILALCTFAALRPPMPRRSSPSDVWFWLGWFVNEQPFVGLAVLALSTYETLATDVGGPTWWLAAALTAAVACGMAALAVRTRSARGVLEAALAEVPDLRVPRRPLPLLRVLLPFLVPRRGVRRLCNRRYGTARSQALDVYLPRRRPDGAPVLLYFHGGGFTIGSKLIGGLPLLYRLAADGWVCASANYRLRTPYPNSLADARAAVAWLRAHARELGADPELLVVAGGSAGAHLAATVALTDDAVSAAIGFYGYYGEVGGDRATPHAHVHPAAPPFLLVHGSLDTLVLAADARAFAADLARTSAAPVVLAELPGTQHNFDVLPSLRLHAISDAVEAFARWATVRRDRDR